MPLNGSRGITVPWCYVCRTITLELRNRMTLLSDVLIIHKNQTVWSHPYTKAYAFWVVMLVPPSTTAIIALRFHDNWWALLQPAQSGQQRPWSIRKSSERATVSYYLLRSWVARTRLVGDGSIRVLLLHSEPSMTFREPRWTNLVKCGWKMRELG